VLLFSPEIPLGTVYKLFTPESEDAVVAVVPVVFSV
jgi:hypothetical protein